jgi:hypothetical protein
MTLEPLLFKNGFRYQLVKRIENFAIYEQKKEGFDYKYYEVIKIQVVKQDVNTKFMSLKAGTEFYPSINQWGQYGWTCGTIERAEELLNILVNESKEKQSVYGLQ